MDYRDILRAYWGYDDFRGIQREIIDSIAGGNDTLGLMPTGGGKSVTFQVPALAMSGMCLVVTPLIALMKDQVAHLRAMNIKAAAVYSGMTQDEIETTLDNCAFGGVKILYVSPERLETDLFITRFKRLNVSFITVDEAHCISQWGYDFRPSYLKISLLRKYKPFIPMLALTATATPRVIDDIQEKLAFKQKNVFRMSFERKNLAYVVRNVTDKRAELFHLLREISGTAIIYVRNRRRTKEISDMLNANGVSSTFYHAGLMTGVRDDRQSQWTKGNVRVMVATNAFGMGIDKPDVRLVVHIDCPDSIEAYFQEAGRAGRDGKMSYAVLLFNSGDERKLWRRIGDNYPSRDYILDVYEKLACFFQIGVGSGCGVTRELSIETFCRTYSLYPSVADAALRILSRTGVISYNPDGDDQPRLWFRVGRDDLYRLGNSSETENRVISVLLRSYSGLFTDFRYIDETAVATQASVTPSVVQEVLMSLNTRHVASYIPGRKVPKVTFTSERLDKTDIVLPPSVYDIRKEQYAERIHRVLDYASGNDVCRSRFLLAYFGETRAGDCGICDVCRGNHIDTAPGGLYDARESIMRLLADGRPHTMIELHSLANRHEYIDEALSSLLAEDVIGMRDGMLTAL